jgi:hypothetical protein
MGQDGPAGESPWDLDWNGPTSRRLGGRCVGTAVEWLSLVGGTSAAIEIVWANSMLGRLSLISSRAKMF